MTMEHSWCDLPNDLLHLIYTMVVGIGQPVRFAAVCTSWRDAVRHGAAQPALPWHISSFYGKHNRKARVYCPEDRKVLLFRVPSKAVVSHFVGAHDGGWVAALRRKHVRLEICNILSGLEVPLSAKQRKFVPRSRHDGACHVQKILFSKAPTSNDCILAALGDSPGDVGLCRVGCRPDQDDDGWIMTQEQPMFEDITFYNGELYGLTSDMELFRFDITSSKDGAKPVVATTRFLSIQHAPPAFRCYPHSDPDNRTQKVSHLFVLVGKIAMARKWWYSTVRPFFKVFELTYGGQVNMPEWAEVTSLGEHALFLGKRCSVAVRVPPGGRGKVQRNRIYNISGLYNEKNGCPQHMHENEPRIKVVHVSENLMRNGMWLIPPSV